MTQSSAMILSILLRFTSKFSSAVFFILVPFVAASLQISLTDGQSVIPVFLIGSAFSQFFVGALADLWGQRRTLLLLLTALGGGSLICSCANSLAFFQLGVLLIALGVGAIAGIGNTLIFSGFQQSSFAARALALSSVLVIWAPALALNLGSAVAQWDWRYYFVAQTLLAAVLWGMVWRNVRTITSQVVASQLLRSPVAGSPVHTAHNATQTMLPTCGSRELWLHLAKSLRGYWELGCLPDYRRIALQMCLLGGGMVVIYTLVIPHTQTALGPQHVLVIGLPFLAVGANCLGRLLAGLLPEHWSGVVEWRWAQLLAYAGGAGIILAKWAGMPLMYIYLPTALYVFALGLTFSTLRVRLMAASQGRSSTSESLLGILMAGSGALLASLATAIATWLGPDLSTGAILICLGLGTTFLRYGPKFGVPNSQFQKKCTWVSQR